ncbi:short chain dehydrogenase/reductase [Xylaria nigripes]|nr:short chain dehydrogenase/reductase [Xylaria nigripes]
MPRLYLSTTVHHATRHYIMDTFRKLTSTLGTGLVLYLSYKLVDTAWLYTRPSSLHRYLYNDATAQRAWALITGSSDGIGKALAFELADHGFNVLLHGRNSSKLEAVRAELQKSHPDVEVRILVADASQCHRVEAVDFERIRDEVADLHLTVLINCAGAGPKPTFGLLEEYSRDDILNTLYLNAAFPALLTATLLPVLKRQYKHRDDKSAESRSSASKRPFLIINIGSVTDDGFPLVSFYSAGKAATHALHKAIAREAVLEGWADGIEIISHRIAAATGVSHIRAPATLLMPDARTMARAILARTGCGRKSVVPYLPHALVEGFMGLLPVSVLDGIIISALQKSKSDDRRKTN